MVFMNLFEITTNKQIVIEENFLKKFGKQDQNQDQDKDQKTKKRRISNNSLMLTKLNFNIS